jgi:hypothetical protein
MLGALRANRETVYKTLWKKLELLPQWPRNANLTYRDLDALSAEMRNWYFGEGGIYLSEKARNAYGIVQKALVESLVAADPASKVGDIQYEAIRVHCSALRSELTEGLYSRREAPVLPTSSPPLSV